MAVLRRNIWNTDYWVTTIHFFILLCLIGLSSGQGDVCSETSCQNEGTCSDVDGTISCLCRPGFGGPDCAIVIPNSPPYFEDSGYIDVVREDTFPGTLLHTFRAADDDGDTIFFFLGEFEGSQHFSIGSNSGQLRLEEPLDREEQQSFYLVVKIRDANNQTAEETKSIFVDDVNDNAPVFTQTDYTITVSEATAVGEALLTIEAGDADLGISSIVVYIIQSIVDDSSSPAPSNLFAISAKGVLTLEDRLDFEVSERYFVTVVAKDSGFPVSLNSSTIVTVIVGDVQDSTPAFLNSSYDVTIPESTPVNSVVLRILARDRDAVNPSDVEYHIVTGNEDGFFSIGQSTGTLHLTRELDREAEGQPSSFTLTVRASEVLDPTSYVETSFTVSVSDVVDEVPVFDKELYYLEIDEDTPPNAVLSPSIIVSDGEDVTHSVLTLELLNPDNYPLQLTQEILVDGGSSNVRTTGSLDYEETQNYILTVTASKKNPDTSEVFTSSATVIVQVLDINDNSPVFTMDAYEEDLLEGLLPGAEVVQVVATDRDTLEQFSQIEYSFAPNQLFSGYFSIDPITGMITTAIEFDYEVHPSPLTLSVNAVNTLQVMGGDGPGFGSTTVIVSLTDVNDNRPIFEQPSYTTCVQENAGPMSVITLQANDADDGLNAAIEYYITGGNPDGAFSMDKESGILSLATPLDREATDSYSFTILAKDLGTPSLTDSVVLSLCVLDVNDNVPEWVEDRVQFQLAEDSAPGPVGSVVATDRDDGRNAELSYQIVPNNPDFAINPQSGEISLIGALDREDVSVVNLTVVVRDGGSPQQTATHPAMVTIIVFDVNDNDPVFTSEFYEFFLIENYSPGILTEIGRVMAVDVDSGVVSSYNFVDPSEFEGFTMTPNSGVIVTHQPFDREVKATYQGNVTAVDGSRKAFAFVAIHIKDENDNAPVFDQDGYVEIVTEGTPAMTFLNVTATDPDAGGNGTLTYSFASGEQVESSFFLNPQTGALSTTASLDREQTASYQLAVVARDNPEYGAPKETEVRVVVVVSDVDDNRPVFEQRLFQMEVAEDVDMSEDLLQVTAIDNDDGINAKVNYRITRGNNDDHFTINGTDGTIRVARPLDRETNPLYSLFIEAYNPANLNGSTDIASVIITVTDVNDEPPVFTQEIYSRPDLLETSAVGSPVLTVTASDPDEGLGGETTFSIVGGNLAGLFAIDPTSGLISTQDFLPQVNERPTYNLTVAATDRAPPFHVSRATVLVLIVQSSAITPVFMRDIYQVNATENQPKGTVVTRVEAFVNGRSVGIMYSLDQFNPMASAYFQINETTGVISTKLPLDREDVDFFPVTVNARDGESPFGSTAVWIHVLDVNDNSPVFENMVYDLTVLEDLAAGVMVTEVSASDADLGANGFVSLAISSGDMDNAFGLSTDDNATYTLVTTKSLDREAVDVYNLIITATDQGTPPMQSALEIDVKVGDSNDNPPMFSHDLYIGRVIEERFSSEPILLLSVLDADLPSTNSYMYTFTEGNEDSKFSINEDGELIQTNLLDRERNDTYDLTITLRDMTYSETFKVTTQVHIVVEDINDNAPVFDPSLYSASILEGAPSSEIVTVSASDADVGVNSDISFNITGPFAELFSIEHETGVLSNVAPLDRELRAVYTLTVTATDSATNPEEQLTGSAEVTITVLDVNDSPPLFSEEFLGPYQVMEGSLGYYIASVSATDPDDMSTQVRYSLTGPNIEYFDVNPITGVLTTKSDIALDYESLQEFNITVAATDEDNLQSMVTIGISVLNSNDNAPRFVNAPYEISLKENSTVAMVKFVVVAMDDDLGPEGVVTYAIESGNEEDAFWIEPETGEVYLNQSLDRESMSSYILTIRASDSPANMMDVRAVDTTLTVSVTDLDDSPPMFPVSSYTGSLQESAEPGASITLLPLLMAVDADSGTLAYSITGDGAALFAIDQVTGLLQLSQGAGLDYEQRQVHRLVAIATDSRGRTAEANITITVGNENDNDPRFTQDSFNFTVQENSEPGVFVGAVSGLDDDGDRVRFALIQGAEGQLVLDPNTGFINVSSEADLDRERHSSYTLCISISDQLSTTEGTVYIHLSDVNDSPPTFVDPVVSLTLSEDMPLSDTFYNVEAVDLDQDANVVYYIEQFVAFDTEMRDISDEVDIFEWFDLGATDGKLCLQRAVDREMISRIDLYILAMDVNGFDGTDDSDPRLKLEIEITDVNDNPPRFLPENATGLLFQAQEESGANTIIGTLRARDPDQGLSGEVRFSVMGDGGVLPLVVDSNTGNIRVLTPFDREETSWVNFTAVAQDRGDAPLSVSIPVVIRVMDINDNNPVFNQSVLRLTVNESSIPGSVVTMVTATDLDEGDFGRISYSLSGGNGVFTIDPENGEISLVSGLDRESVNQYILTVMARDNPEGTGNSRRETSLMVVIEVSDFNEFAPRPSEPVFRFSVPEGMTPGSEVGTIRATDRDNQEPRFVFTITGSDQTGWASVFSINSTTGIIYLLADIDGSNITLSPVYTLHVEISDGGIPAQVATVDTVISLKEFDKNPPFFEQNIVNISVPEDFSTGLPIAVVMAFDPDEEGDVIYSIAGPPDVLALFTISDNGELRFIGSTLDHETRSSYMVDVMVVDNDGLTASAVVNIMVTDVNDQAPVFSQEVYEFTVVEHQMSGSFVGMVATVDADSHTLNQETTYSIISGDSDFFGIDSTSGNITARQPVDREQVGSTMSLRIEARNTMAPAGVELSSRAEVVISITDINDNPPTFVQDRYEDFILESVSPGTLILEVAATDIDLDENGQFTYSITDGNELGLFRVDPSNGRILVNGTLSEQPDLTLYQVEMTVTATDHGSPPLSGNTTVVVNIMDANDEPEFVVPEKGQSLQLPENQPPPHFIIQVRASDRDLGPNGQVTYGLVSEDLDSRLFSIDPDTGDLYANFSADREARSDYTIILEATDKGENPLSVTMVVSVNVTDLNDNEPAFLRLEPENKPIVQTMEVSENVPLDTLVGRVTPAFDEDVGENSVMRYFIVGGNEDGVFSLDPTSRDIYVVGDIDREASASYSLIIMATNEDMVTPSPPDAKVLLDIDENRSLKEVRVTINDINDNGPAFESGFLTLGISLYVDRFEEVAQVEAIDPDVAGSGLTRYSIVDEMFVQEDMDITDQEYFIIDEGTGMISIQNFFQDKHTKGFFEIVVRALDPETELSDLQTIRMYVLDLDQQVILVIDSPVKEVMAREEELTMLLSNITMGEVQIEDISELITETGKDEARTMVTLYVINLETNTILDSEVVIRRIDESSLSIDELFLNQHVYDIYPLLINRAPALFGTMGISLLAIALLLLFGNTLFIIILCCLRWRYLRMVTGATSGVLYGRGIRNNLNHTDFSSYDGSNPAFDFDGSLTEWPSSRSDIAGREALEASMQFLSEDIPSSAPGDVIMTTFISEKALKGDYTQGKSGGKGGSPPGSRGNMLGSLNSLRSEGSGASAPPIFETKANESKSPSSLPKSTAHTGKGSLSPAQVAQSFAEFQTKRVHGGERRGSLIKIDEDADTFDPKRDYLMESSGPPVNETEEIRRILQELTSDGRPTPSGISYDSASSHAALEAYRDQLEYDNELTPITENDEDALSTVSSRSRRGSGRMSDSGSMKVAFEMDVDDQGFKTAIPGKHWGAVPPMRGDDPNFLLRPKTPPSKMIDILSDEEEETSEVVQRTLAAAAAAAAKKKRQPKSGNVQQQRQPGAVTVTQPVPVGSLAVVRQLNSGDGAEHIPLEYSHSNMSEEDNVKNPGRILIDDDDSSSDAGEDSSDTSDFELEGIPGVNEAAQVGKTSGYYEVQRRY